MTFDPIFKVFLVHCWSLVRFTTPKETYSKGMLGYWVSKLVMGCSYIVLVVCERAGPGFYVNQLPDPKTCAKNVACIHTSGDKGMQARNCHQDWSLGICGVSQPAAGPAPKGDHGMCPYFWDYSFNTTFAAVVNPYPGRCPPNGNTATTWPAGFKLGYDPKRNK